MAFLILLIGVLGAGLLIGHNYRPSSSGRDRHVLYYEDPMHPAYRSAKPGIAPDCGMQLVPVYAEDVERPMYAPGQSDPNSVYIDSSTRQRYGIQLAKVERGSENNLLRVYGRVAPDQSRIYSVNLGTEGYVKETSGDAIGNHVTKDQHLALVYSPDFLSMVGGYLSANERTGTNTIPSTIPTQNAASAQARADRLRNLGMSEIQIEEIRTTRKIPEDVYVVSPTDGFIISRNISPGMRFERHDELYRIADLSRVWILAEVFGKDVQAFRPASVVHVTLTDTGETFTARVSDVLPELDPVTNTLKLRLEVQNPGFHLRPGMFVDIDLPSSVHEGLSVPTDAIVDTGFMKRVYVESGQGDFEPRAVQTGRSFGDRMQILKGLQEGEKVVSSGTFLVDSETRLHSIAVATNATVPDYSKPEIGASNHPR